MEHLLKSHGLSHTSCRIDVLNEFTKKGTAISSNDIETALSSNYDRATIYRTIKTFLDKGIIHKVLNDTGSLKYALCPSHCHNNEHNHDHLHFKCIKCNKTNCIDDIKIPPIKAPRGYIFMKSDLLIQGICKSCNI